jgi:hypothetical protein
MVEAAGWERGMLLKDHQSHQKVSGELSPLCLSAQVWEDSEQKLYSEHLFYRGECLLASAAAPPAIWGQLIRSSNCRRVDVLLLTCWPCWLTRHLHRHLLPV